MASALATPSDESSFAVSKAAAFLAAYTLASLGHKVGLKECFDPSEKDHGPAGFPGTHWLA